MILNPLPNSPIVTQKFGERPEVYKPFGLAGHNGLDQRAKSGTPIYAPFEGVLTVFNEGDKGYGLYVKITKPNVEVTLAHLEKVTVKSGQMVYLGDQIGLTDNTGFSSAAHSHLTLKFLKDGKILNYDNGYKGAVDPLPYLINWIK